MHNSRHSKRQPLHRLHLPARAKSAWVERLLWVASLAVAGCSGDHDLLAQKSGGTGGAADVASAVDVVGDERRSARPVDASDASFETVTPDVVDEPLPPEPPGRFSVTLTNGLVDADSARFCFVPVVLGQERRDQVLSVPEIAFGKSLILSELRGIDRSTMDVRPYIVVEEASGVPAGQGCAALDIPDGSAAEDGAARRRFVAALPLIPAGTLAEGRSYLGVVTGCVRPWPFSEADGGVDGGDAGRDDVAPGDDGGDAARDATDASGDGATMDVFRPPVRTAICGPASGSPNAGLVLVRLSQRGVGTRLGLQAVHASTAVSIARVAIVGAGGASPIFSADIGPFQITPRDMPVAVGLELFGPTLGAASVQVASPIAAFAAVASSLASAFMASGIDETGLQEGDLLSLVLIGAQPGQAPGPPWNAARIAVVRNAPLAGGD